MVWSRCTLLKDAYEGDLGNDGSEDDMDIKHDKRLSVTKEATKKDKGFCWNEQLKSQPSKAKDGIEIVPAPANDSSDDSVTSLTSGRFPHKGDLIISSWLPTLNS